MKTRRLPLLVVLLALTTKGSAQHLPSPWKAPFAFFEHFGEAQGVTDRIRVIRQDQQGYLWCVTHSKGLLRFDGVGFRSYTYDPNDPHSLPNNAIEDLLVDKNGLIWLATQTGIVRFDPLSERFSSIPSAVSGGFICLLEDRNHRIWAGTVASGLTFFDPHCDSMVAWRSKRIQNGYTGQLDEQGDFSRFCTLTESADGTLWASVNRYYEHKRPGDFALAAIDPLRGLLVYFPPQKVLEKSATRPKWSTQAS